MYRTDVVEGDGHHHHCEDGSALVAEGGKQQTNGGGKGSGHCCSNGHALPQVSVAAASEAPSSIGVEDAELLLKMREACEKQKCSTKDISDATLLRFLRARSMKVDKAAKMFVNHQQWRASYVPLGYIPDSECPRELAAKKFFMQGRSRHGWAIIIIHVKHHHSSQRDLEEFKRVICNMFDKAIASAAPEAEKMLVIVDLNGIGFGNLDARGFIAGFTVLQDYYPDRLARLLMINAPGIFMTMWKVVNRFLDPEIRSKIVWVKQDKITEVCLADVDKEVLPVTYGGKAQLTLLQDAVVPNWPPVKNV